MAACYIANRISEDLSAVSHDRHLRVEWSPFKPPAQRQGSDPAAEARMQRELERHQFTFEKLEILQENVGYVKFNAFAAPEICGPTVAAAMNFLAHIALPFSRLTASAGGAASNPLRVMTVNHRIPVATSCSPSQANTLRGSLEAALCLMVIASSLPSHRCCPTLYARTRPVRNRATPVRSFQGQLMVNGVLGRRLARSSGRHQAEYVEPRPTGTASGRGPVHGLLCDQA